METDLDFTKAIGLDDSYVNSVSKIRRVLSKCTHIHIRYLDSSLKPQNLKQMNPRTFDIFDFFDTLFEEFCINNLTYDTDNLTEECFNQYYNINLFDIKIFFILVKKGSPTVGEWVKHIINNCVPESFIEKSKKMSVVCPCPELLSSVPKPKNED